VILKTAAVLERVDYSSEGSSQATFVLLNNRPLDRAERVTIPMPDDWRDHVRRNRIWLGKAAKRWVVEITYPETKETNPVRVDEAVQETMNAWLTAKRHVEENAREIESLSRRLYAEQNRTDDLKKEEAAAWEKVQALRPVTTP
jgi:glucan phosphorylase